MKRSIVALSVALTSFAVPCLADEASSGAPPCAGRHQVVDELKLRFSENTAGVGLTEQGAMIELLTSEAGSWSLLLNFPDGRSCLMATGSSWEGQPPKMPDRDS